MTVLVTRQTCPIPKFHGAKIVLDAPFHSQVLMATEYAFSYSL